MKWVTLILGVVLAVGPWVFGYSDDSTALWTSLVLGVVLAVLGIVEQYKAGAIVAVVTALTPWILGFNDIDAALWPVLIIGIVFAVLAAYKGWFAQPTQKTA